jgi:hypothetical protein
MPPDFVFTFHPDQRKRFRDGSLIAHWTARYPELFDQDDVRLLQTEHQRKYHFFEWLSAVLLFEATGYLSLVESYTSATHPMKLSRFREVVGEDVFHWARANESGQPDLFVYRPRSDDWFFCEVKGGHDRIRDNQKKWIEDFCAVDKYRKVRVIHLIEYKSR